MTPVTRFRRYFVMENLVSCVAMKPSLLENLVQPSRDLPRHFSRLPWLYRNIRTSYRKQYASNRPIPGKLVWRFDACWSGQTPETHDDFLYTKLNFPRSLCCVSSWPTTLRERHLHGHSTSEIPYDIWRTQSFPGTVFNFFLWLTSVHSEIDKSTNLARTRDGLKRRHPRWTFLVFLDSYNDSLYPKREG